MSISSRRWIRWIPDTPTEPTDTIVLTSPKGVFVDVRTITGIDEVGTAALEKTEAELLTISAEQPGPKPADELHAHQARGRDELAVTLDRLDWAFAGYAEDLGSVEAGGKRRAWTHWVDSRKSNASGDRDEGVNFPYEGDTGDSLKLELEKGRMLNPATSQEQDYEELWAEESIAMTGNPPSKLSVVMVARQSAQVDPIGVVIRLGGYCQGVLRVADRFVVERWLWSDKFRTWKRVVRIGSGELPCSIACNEVETLKEGSTVKATEGGHVWSVEEMYRG